MVKKQRKVLVILPISRKEYLLPTFKCLQELSKPTNTELLLIIDGDEELEEMVDGLLDILTFERIQVRNFGDSPAAPLAKRRNRIAQIHNFAKQFVSEAVTEVFLIEDDTVYPSDAISKLFSIYDRNENTGAVAGTELGRWATPYLGAWTADDIENPSVIKSLAPHNMMTYQVDAVGLYCTYVNQELYFEHLFNVFDEEGENGLSCDVNFGLWMRNKGYKVFMEWSLQCGHYQDSKQLKAIEVDPVQVVFEKDKNGKWLGRTEIL